jgi:hypothetical protein
MIHYFISWFEYTDHHENYKRHVQRGRDETRISNTKGAARFLVIVVGCHPRYLLPTHITRYGRIKKSSTSEKGVGSSTGAAGAGAYYSYSL